jgi:hypothetical protein
MISLMVGRPRHGTVLAMRTTTNTAGSSNPSPASTPGVEAAPSASLITASSVARQSRTLSIAASGTALVGAVFSAFVVHVDDSVRALAPGAAVAASTNTWRWSAATDAAALRTSDFPERE